MMDLPFVQRFRSIFHLTQLCVPHLIKTKGSIVNVSSVNGQRSVGIQLHFFVFFLLYDVTNSYIVFDYL